MVNVKTPNKKRKSLGNASSPPKVAKIESPLKTPGKGNATPGKGKATPGNKTPKPNQQQNNVKTPKVGGDEAHKQTPFKKQQQASGKKNKQLNKRASDSETEVTSPKKMKKFAGTAKLGGSPKKEKKNAAGGKKRKGQFYGFKELVKKGDKAVVADLELKIQDFLARKDLTKTARRKLKLLQKLKSVATGEPLPPKVVTESKKRRERKKDAIAKSQEGGGVNKQKKGAQKAVAVKVEEEDDDDDSDESEIEINPAKIIKTENDEEDSDDDDEEAEEEESGDEEEESGDEEEEEDESDEEEEPVNIPKGKQSKSPQSGTSNEAKKKTRYIVFVGNIPYDVAKKEISEHFSKAGEIRHIRIPSDKQTNKPRGFAYVEFDDEVSYQKALSLHHTFINGRRINVLYTQGGKKKGQEKKNEVKAKNFKLQAMRKQGQLAGSTKQTNKRSSRRLKQNTKVNGSN